MRVKVKAFKDTWVLKGDAYLPDMAKFEDLGMHTYRDFAPELGQLLKAQMPKAGSYEFVTCAGEEWLRLTLISTGEFGQVGGHCGHAMLADEQPVLFAGQARVRVQVRVRVRTVGLGVGLRIRGRVKDSG